jgi:hypothetical protein
MIVTGIVPDRLTSEEGGGGRGLLVAGAFTAALGQESISPIFDN